jgi:DNA-binding transcriptional ArsR family regulator
MANPLRVKIISALKEKSMNVGELSKILKEEQSKLSHSLSNLRACKIVSVERKGKEKIYSLNKKTILPILKLIDTHANNNCGGECKNCVFA